MKTKIQPLLLMDCGGAKREKIIYAKTSYYKVMGLKFPIVTNNYNNAAAVVLLLALDIIKRATMRKTN